MRYISTASFVALNISPAYMFLSKSKRKGWPVEVVKLIPIHVAITMLVIVTYTQWFFWILIILMTISLTQEILNIARL